MENQQPPQNGQIGAQTNPADASNSTIPTDGTVPAANNMNAMVDNTAAPTADDQMMTAPVAPPTMPVAQPNPVQAATPMSAGSEPMMPNSMVDDIPAQGQMTPPMQSPVVTAPAAAPQPVVAPTPTQPTMPSATPAVQPAPVQPVSGGILSGDKKNIKILVVEDELDARTMFVDLLSSEGFETSSAVDGVDALAKAAADKFNMILLDIVMPNKDGIEVLQEIKSNPDKYSTPVIVMLTNISGDAAVEKAMELGAAGFRLKVDTEPTQLLKDVEDFLAGKVQDIEQEPVSKTIT